ncbi:MAG TPA: phosphate ABC transporter substrate-binding protein [Thermoguttaceae bacterium]|nr:phosphate ABC transporter substrate-binding protein [Thermoguttaceae bacterium]
MKAIVVVLCSLAILCVGSGYAMAEKTTITVDGSTTVGPIAKAFAGYFMGTHPDVNVNVSESGSGIGAQNFCNGTCDVAAMSRFMKLQEFKTAVDKGYMPVAHVVAVDGVAVVVHPSNRVEKLTMNQLKSIYEGKVKNWSELGGPSMPIVKISRETSSGTYEVFDEKVMKGTRVAGDAETVASNGAMRTRVQNTPAAIGYIGLGFVDRTVKPLKMNGILPNRQTVATGTYPIARPLFLFTNGYPAPGSALHAFVTIHLSEKGQEIVEDRGFVPVTDY